MSCLAATSCRLGMQLIKSSPAGLGPESKSPVTCTRPKILHRRAQHADTVRNFEQLGNELTKPEQQVTAQSKPVLFMPLVAGVSE